MRLKVLLLEDQDFQRESISGLLENILPEPEIETADTYDSAKSLWDNDEWNFVILDINIKSGSGENSFDGNSLYEDIVRAEKSQPLSPIVVRYTGDINVLQSLNRLIKNGHIIKKGEDDLKIFATRFREEESERFENIKNDLHTTNVVIEAIDELKDIYEKDLQLAYPEKEIEPINKICSTVIFKEKYTLSHIFPTRLKKIISGREVVSNLEELKGLLESVNWNSKLNQFLTTGSNYDVLHAPVSHNNNTDNWGKFVESENSISLNQLSNLLPEQKKSGLNLKLEILKALYNKIPDDQNLSQCPPWKDIDESVWIQRREDFKVDWKNWNKDDISETDGALNCNSIPQKLLNKIEGKISDSSITLYYENLLRNSDAVSWYIFRPLIDWFVEIFTIESSKVLSAEEQSDKNFFYVIYKSEFIDAFNIGLAHNGSHPNASELQNFLKDKNSSWYNFQELNGWAVWELWIKDIENNEWKVFIPNVATPLNESNFSTDVFKVIDKENVTIIAKLRFERN